jgi:hypothetical protein
MEVNIEQSKKILVSQCCHSIDMVEPADEEEIESMGSLWRAYACYICHKCGKDCETIEAAEVNGELVFPSDTQLLLNF